MFRQTEQYVAKSFISMFPYNQWSLGGLQIVIRNTDDTKIVDRHSDLGSLGSFPRTARLGQWRQRLRTYVAVSEGQFERIVQKRLISDVLSEFSYLNSLKYC